MIIKKLKLLRSILGAFKQFFDAPQRALSGIFKIKNSPENSPKKKRTLFRKSASQPRKTEVWHSALMFNAGDSMPTDERIIGF